MMTKEQIQTEIERHDTALHYINKALEFFNAYRGSNFRVLSPMVIDMGREDFARWYQQHSSAKSALQQVITDERTETPSAD